MYFFSFFFTVLHTLLSPFQQAIYEQCGCKQPTLILMGSLRFFVTVTWLHAKWTVPNVIKPSPHSWIVSLKYRTTVLVSTLLYILFLLLHKFWDTWKRDLWGKLRLIVSWKELCKMSFRIVNRVTAVSVVSCPIHEKISNQYFGS